VLKKLIIFNIIQDMLVEVAGTTYTDIIEEIYNSAIFPPIFTTKRSA